MTLFVMGLICIGGAAFLVRFFIALCADCPKHTCEVTHVERSPYSDVRVRSVRVMQPRGSRKRANEDVYEVQPRYSQVR